MKKLPGAHLPGQPTKVMRKNYAARRKADWHPLSWLTDAGKHEPEVQKLLACTPLSQIAYIPMGVPVDEYSRQLFSKGVA